MRRKSLIDEFAPPGAIKPLRAPRVDPRVGATDLIAALDKMRRLVVSGANNAAMEQALGELRANLNFVRHQWRLRSSTAMEVQHTTSAKLYEKSGKKPPPSSGSNSALRELYDRRRQRRDHMEENDPYGWP